MRSGRSPLQNRVTPFGDVVAIAQRGLFIGNRGIIHDPATKTLLGRRWTTKAWLVCVPDYKGRHREVMGGRSWTELFFLDETVALAAGASPLLLLPPRGCRGISHRLGQGEGGKAPLAPEMDAELHQRCCLPSFRRTLQRRNMMAADYRHIGGRENRLGRHYSRFSAFWPAPALAGQSLALRKLCDAGSNRRSRARA